MVFYYSTTLLYYLIEYLLVPTRKIDGATLAQPTRLRACSFQCHYLVSIRSSAFSPTRIIVHADPLMLSGTIKYATSAWCSMASDLYAAWCAFDGSNVGAYSMQTADCSTRYLVVLPDQPVPTSDTTALMQPPSTLTPTPALRGQGELGLIPALMHNVPYPHLRPRSIVCGESSCAQEAPKLPSLRIFLHSSHTGETTSYSTGPPS